MSNSWIVLGALGCALAIAAGAFGAHGLRGRLGAEALVWWESGARYLMYAAFGLILVGLAAAQLPRRGFDSAGLALLAGGLLFSGSLGALALGAPRWLGAVTPVGGALMILGFLLFAWTALKG